MKITGYLLLVAFWSLLVYASLGLPNRGDATATMFQDKSPAGSPGAAAYYIRRAYEDTDTPNMVTAILADYRGYDTLGEETVILTAGLICYLVLRRRKKGGKDAPL